MSYDKQTGRTNAYLNSRKPYDHLDIEMVTDNVVQIMITAELTEARVDALAWQLAHAVDAVALFAEDEIGNPFLSFIVVFSAAWELIQARRTGDRKRSAEVPALPPFLEARFLATEE